MKPRSFNMELPAIVSSVFNLAMQSGVDPLRLQREAWAREEREREATEYQAKMQRTLAECPGVVGFDAPTCESGRGKVVVEPGRICEAMDWLKRRFHTNENLGLSHDQGLCVEIAPRAARRKGQPRRTVNFNKPEQFELTL